MGRPGPPIDTNQLTAWRSALQPATETETDLDIATRKLVRADVKRRYVSDLRKRHLAKIFQFPEPGESVHIVSSGRHDYFSFVPLVLEHMTAETDYFGSTWTMNRATCLELFDLFDAGKLKSIAMLTGLYFKQREPAVYATLVDGLADRGQRYRAAKNHAKVMLFSDGACNITIEGSANFTNNPRIEQNTVTNDPTLYAFHRKWMEELLP